MHQSIDKKNKIILYLIFLFILSSTNIKFLENKNAYTLKIQVKGLLPDKNIEIQNELNKISYQNIFSLGSEKIKNIINKHNIIEEYSIKKFYPSQLDIYITPTKFVAKITDGNQLMVGANGKLIRSEQDNRTLPYIFGQFDSKKFLKFKQKVDISKFNFIKFKTVYFFPSNRWDILTNDNILIRLPQKNISESLNLAHKIITAEHFKYKDIIDLRIENHLIVK
tara:strand:- start:3269 stop:3937 length:669 start_codon:yes stop_codon:yes gene_type:complete